MSTNNEEKRVDTNCTHNVVKREGFGGWFCADCGQPFEPTKEGR